MVYITYIVSLLGRCLKKQVVELDVHRDASAADNFSRCHFF